MAIPFLNNINLNDNELQNAKLHITGSSPGDNQGQIYLHNTQNKFKVYTTGWKNVAFEDWVTSNFNNYVLPLAADGTRGGIQIGYTENGKNYPVELSSEKAFVNVPIFLLKPSCGNLTLKSILNDSIVLFHLLIPTEESLI